jgi:hypothetical protein
MIKQINTLEKDIKSKCLEKLKEKCHMLHHLLSKLIVLAASSIKVPKGYYVMKGIVFTQYRDTV